MSIDDPDPKIARLLAVPETTCCPFCGALAEVTDRWTWPSTDGPVDHWSLRCSDPDPIPRHFYNGPVER